MQYAKKYSLPLSTEYAFIVRGDRYCHSKATFRNQQHSILTDYS